MLSCQRAFDRVWPDFRTKHNFFAQSVACTKSSLTVGDFVDFQLSQHSSAPTSSFLLQNVHITSTSFVLVHPVLSIQSIPSLFIQSIHLHPSLNIRSIHPTSSPNLSFLPQLECNPLAFCPTSVNFVRPLATSLEIRDLIQFSRARTDGHDLSQTLFRRPRRSHDFPSKSKQGSGGVSSWQCLGSALTQSLFTTNPQM